mgnify:CR=1 FL=1
MIGGNKVYLEFKSKYSYDRDGCKTCFEPYGALKVFPNFDQPDLKAKFKLAIAAEK